MTRFKNKNQETSGSSKGFSLISKSISKLILGIAVCLSFLIFIAFKFDPLMQGGIEKGKIVSLFHTQTRYGSGTRFVVELESGDIVQINASEMGPYKKGREVVVQRMVSKIFHKTVYRFVEYPTDMR